VVIGKLLIEQTFYSINEFLDECVTEI